MQKMTAVVGSGNTKERLFFNAEGNADSEPLRIPHTGNDVLVVLVPGSGVTAKVQFSISSPARIREDEATWLDWEQGNTQVAAHARVVTGITALRVVSSGAYTWEVSA